MRHLGRCEEPNDRGGWWAQLAYPFELSLRPLLTNSGCYARRLPGALKPNFRGKIQECRSVTGYRVSCGSSILSGSFGSIPSRPLPSRDQRVLLGLGTTASAIFHCNHCTERWMTSTLPMNVVSERSRTHEFVLATIARRASY